MITLWLAVVCLTPLTTPPLTLHAQLAENMLGGTFQPATNAQPYHYRLFEPQISDDNELFPLIIWLHGYGAYEYDHQNIGQLLYTELIFGDHNLAQPGATDRFGFYFLAFQLPAQSLWVDDSRPETERRDDALDHLMLLVDELLSKKRIDRERISLVGISGGGRACWDLVRRHPQRFAAAAPLACPAETTAVANLLATPFWTFVSERDLAVPVENVTAAVTRLRQAGGTAQITVTPGGGHNSWGPAFSDYNLLDWLLKQRRGRLTWWAIVHGRSWQWLVYWGIPLGLITYGWQQLRPRRPKGSTNVAPHPHASGDHAAASMPIETHD